MPADRYKFKAAKPGEKEIYIYIYIYIYVEREREREKEQGVGEREEGIIELRQRRYGLLPLSLHCRGNELSLITRGACKVRFEFLDAAYNRRHHGIVATL